ncbi:hypothetical protein IC582_000771 [Cucumis melo]|uniref:Glycolipid transfer protein 3 n=2 Tax=Cucumis melo TaxID=3656 RepID=A0A1S3CEW2_CUCME|nr:glycolipid transfer protein 3 [Cucumis melo]
MEKSAIKSAIQHLSQLLNLKPQSEEDPHTNSTHNDDDTVTTNIAIPILPFISLCNSLIRVLDKIGPTMGVLRQEIHQNIQRFEMGEELRDLIEILKKEGSEGTARSGSSCSRAFLWLIRSLDFTAKLLEKISEEPEMKMEEAVEESYNLTLKPWHGWISLAAYKIALKLVPDRATFINTIMENDDTYSTFLQDIHTLIPLLMAFLQQAHSILRLYNLDRIKSK